MLEGSININHTRRLNDTLVSLVLIISFCLALAACGSGSSSQANLFRERLPVFEAAVQNSFSESTVPGMAIAIVTEDQVIYIKAFGVRRQGAAVLIDTDTVFQLASVSKSFTSATIASLVADATLSWSDRIADIYPAFQLQDTAVNDRMTLLDLLAHHSGLPEYAGDELISFEHDRAEMLRRLRYLPVVGFGTTYAYQNAVITAGAEAAAAKASQPFGNLVAKRVLEPLGMASASTTLAGFLAKTNRADLHVRNVASVQVPGPPENDDINSPAGGVSASIADMAKYAQMQLASGRFRGQQVIAAAALAETHKPYTLKQKNAEVAEAYGLGWFVRTANGETTVYHGGDFSSGAATHVALFPARKLALVVLTNSFPDGKPLVECIKRTLVDVLDTGQATVDYFPDLKAAMEKGIADLTAKTEKLGDPPSPGTPARVLSTYAGTYDHTYYGPVTVTVSGDHLVLVRGRSTEQVPLAHWDADTFAEVRPMMFDVVIQAPVRFTVASAGVAESVKLSYLHEAQDPIFTRVP